MTDVVIGCDIGTQSCKALAMDAIGRACWRVPAEGYPVAIRIPAGRSRTRATGSGRCVPVIGARRERRSAPSGSPPSASRDRSTASCPSMPRARRIGPGIIWMDRRATAEAAELAARFDAARRPRPDGRQHRRLPRRAQDRLAAGPGAGERVAGRGRVPDARHACRGAPDRGAADRPLERLDDAAVGPPHARLGDRPDGRVGRAGRVPGAGPRRARSVAGTLRPDVAAEHGPRVRCQGRGGHRRRALGVPRGGRPGAGPGVRHHGHRGARRGGRDDAAHRSRAGARDAPPPGARRWTPGEPGLRVGRQHALARRRGPGRPGGAAVRARRRRARGQRRAGVRARARGAP